MEERALPSSVEQTRLIPLGAVRLQERERNAALPKFLRYSPLVIAEEYDIRLDLLEHPPRTQNRVAWENAKMRVELCQDAYALPETLARRMPFELGNDVIRRHHRDKFSALCGGLGKEMLMSLVQSVKDPEYHPDCFHTPPSYHGTARGSPNNPPIDAAPDFRYAESMNDYRGVIIEESLADKTVLGTVKIVSTEIEPVTEKHQTPWLKQWTLHTVEIPETDAERVAEELSRVIIRDPLSWYADFKNASRHFIIFPDKVFSIDRRNQGEYEAAKQYGISLGIPEHQVNFSPEIVVPVSSGNERP